MTNRQQGFQSPNGEKPEDEAKMQDKLRLPPEHQEREHQDGGDAERERQRQQSQQ
ncbi:MAG: hypothetical protein ACN6O1_08460 [Comamonas sp.]|jgi:hypothetical protein|uniref:hypothetical protein n=1 Tax=unclassified Comamonas TaxID=2638500 RepID=UPI0028A258FD|nr:hypothetical protein [Comamonas sp.]